MKLTKEEKLDKTINQGRLRYILVDGVLFWGVGTGILFCLLQHFTGTPQTASSVAQSLILFPIGGVFWGAATWSVLKKQYSKISNNEL